jgi:hypothetical protein
MDEHLTGSWEEFEDWITRTINGSPRWKIRTIDSPPTGSSSPTYSCISSGGTAASSPAPRTPFVASGLSRS